jgi:GDPmannose 4,6-dehydratase
MKAIIFGSTGQDGYYLAKLLFDKGIEVLEVARSGAGLVGDVADNKFVEPLINEHRPGFIFHLAANSTTRHDVLFENHQTISTGTWNILESVKKHSPLTKVFLSGSGLQFRNNGQPIDESFPFDAPNPYAVSRIQSVYASRYFRSFGIKSYVGYFFNHESPRRSERHVSKMIANATIRIRNGSKEVIEIGDPSTRKEWTFAGDIVKAIWKLVNQDDVHEAVLGSGKAYSIEQWLEECFGKIGKDWRQFVRIKEGYRAEYGILVSNPALIKSLGWQPEVSFNDLAELMINDNSNP